MIFKYVKSVCHIWLMAVVLSLNSLAALMTMIYSPNEALWTAAAASIKLAQLRLSDEVSLSVPQNSLLNQIYICPIGADGVQRGLVSHHAQRTIFAYDANVRLKQRRCTVILELFW